MTERSSSGQENASFYARGVTERLAGQLLENKVLLEILDVFGADGLRAYILGYIDGNDDAEEED